MPFNADAMRVMHVPYTYMPDAAGGTEVYVAALAAELKPHGWTSVVAAPGPAEASYDWAGTEVLRFAVAPHLDLDAQYGEGDVLAAQGFARALEQTQPDLVHFHALTAGASALAMREAVQRRIPVLFTYHSPTVSCVRGGMMRWGARPCDGVMRPRLCSACVLEGKGVPRAASLAMAALPCGPLAWVGRALGPGRLATALQLPAMVRLRHAATRTAWAGASHLVAVCDWVRAVLLRNGVPPEKITVCRQGLPASQPVSRPPEATSTSSLRLAYFGRLDVRKGLQVLVAAMKRMPHAQLSLDIFGVAQGHENEPWWLSLQEDMSQDARIQLRPPVPSDQVTSTMQAYQLIVIPSVWMETGPLVAYEALAAGVPVLGSDLGGIAEILANAAPGQLIPSHSVEGWVNALSMLIRQPDIIDEWKRKLPAARTMAQVAAEMAGLYAAQRQGDGSNFGGTHGIAT